MSATDPKSIELRNQRRLKLLAANKEKQTQSIEKKEEPKESKITKEESKREGEPKGLKINKEEVVRGSKDDEKKISEIEKKGGEEKRVGSLETAASKGSSREISDFPAAPKQTSRQSQIVPKQAPKQSQIVQAPRRTYQAPNKELKVEGERTERITNRIVQKREEDIKANVSKIGKQEYLATKGQELISIPEKSRGALVGAELMRESRISFGPTSGTELEKTKYVTRFVGEYFGKRNGIFFSEAKLEEGKNYTNETLTYMTPARRADEITYLVTEKIMPYSSLVIFECCSGIGGNTLSFLENQNVVKVVAHEIREDRREILLNNVRAYNQKDIRIDNIESKLEIRGSFNGVDKKYPGSVLYFDPPWLPSEISGDVATPDQYVRSGIKVGDKTMEEWMSENKHVALIMMRVPPPYTDPTGKVYPGYELGEVEGWTIHVDDESVTKSRIVFAISEKGIRAGMSASPTDLPNQDWLDQLYDFLDQHLGQIIGDAELRGKILSKEMLEQYWAKAFTYKSYDTKFNYEELEKLGDSVLKLTFVVYLKEKYPEIRKDGISVMQDRYADKTYQSGLSKRMGLDTVVRTRNHKKTIHMLEDLVESLLGALFSVGNRIGRPGYGYVLCQQYVNKIYSKYVIFNEEYLAGRPITQFKENFEGLKWGKEPDRSIVKTEDGVSVTLRITDIGYKYLQDRGIPVNRVIGVASAYTEKEAKAIAYEEALTYFVRLGLTGEWFAAEKEKLFNEDPRVAPLLPKFLNRLKREGFVKYRMEFQKEASDKNNYYVVLIGIRANDSEAILISNTARKINLAKIGLIDIYANEKKNTFY